MNIIKYLVVAAIASVLTGLALTHTPEKERQTTAPAVSVPTVSAATVDKTDVAKIDTPKPAPKRLRASYTTWTDDITHDKGQMFCLDQDGVYEKGFGTGGFCIRDLGDKESIFWDLGNDLEDTNLITGGVMQVRAEFPDGTVKVRSYTTAPGHSPAMSFMEGDANKAEFQGMIAKNAKITARFSVNGGDSVTFHYTSKNFIGEVQ